MFSYLENILSTVNISCPSCGHSKNVQSDKLPQREVTVTCPQCNNKFEYSPLQDVPDFMIERVQSCDAKTTSTDSYKCPNCYRTIDRSANECCHCHLILKESTHYIHKGEIINRFCEFCNKEINIGDNKCKYCDAYLNWSSDSINDINNSDSTISTGALDSKSNKNSNQPEKIDPNEELTQGSEQYGWECQRCGEINANMLIKCTCGYEDVIYEKKKMSEYNEPKKAKWSVLSVLLFVGFLLVIGYRIYETFGANGSNGVAGVLAATFGVGMVILIWTVIKYAIILIILAFIASIFIRLVLGFLKS